MSETIMASRESLRSKRLSFWDRHESIRVGTDYTLYPEIGIARYHGELNGVNMPPLPCPHELLKFSHQFGLDDRSRLMAWDGLRMVEDPVQELERQPIGAYVFISPRLEQSLDNRGTAVRTTFTEPGLMAMFADAGYDLLARDGEAFCFRRTRRNTCFGQYRYQPFRDARSLTINTAGGIGDVMWSLLHLQSIQDQHGIETLRVNLADDGFRRAAGFVERVRFVNNVRYRVFPVVKHEVATDHHGHEYVPSGYLKDGTYTMLLNPWLEWRGRLAEALPRYGVSEDFWGQYDFGPMPQTFPRERPYAVLYLGPLEGSTIAGQNCEGIWTVADWHHVMRTVADMGLRTVVVGYGRSDDLYAQMVLKRAPASVENWVNRTTVSELVTLLKNSSLVVGYGCGITILSTYLTVPTVMFWRPEGLSLCLDKDIWYSDDFATNWLLGPSPHYYPAWYGTDTASTVSAACRRIVNQ